MSSRLSRIEDWEKLSADARYGLDAMASRCGVSLRHLQRFFKLQFRQPLGQRVRRMRCRQAAVLLSTGMRSDAVARELGYANSSHFCHEFKKAYGVAPQSFARHEGSAEMSPLINNVAFKQYFAVDARLRTLQPWRRSV